MLGKHLESLYLHVNVLIRMFDIFSTSLICKTVEKNASLGMEWFSLSAVWEKVMMDMLRFLFFQRDAFSVSKPKT
jgi:hypothetical protein